MQGSRILSRSFTIPIDDQATDSDSDSDGEEDPTDIAVMIPLADMLNAAHGKDNAHLVKQGGGRTESSKHDNPGFTITATRSISKGEQIVSDDVELRQRCQPHSLRMRNSS
jgi:SET domain-containing protein 6